MGRDARLAQAADRAHDVLHDLRSEALARLVEQHEAGTAGKRARYRHHLQFPAGHVLALAWK
jgi:hypothetical protein